MLKRSLILFLALLAVSILPLKAQSNPNATPKNEPMLKTTTRAVVVDVVVSGGNGTSVGGLQQRDFSVLEDGKNQTIDFFEEHAATNAPANSLPQLPPNVYSNEPAVTPNGAANVILLDSLNTEAQDQITVRKQVVSFLQNMPPGTQIAIFQLASKLTLVQRFTTDVSLLRAALNSSSAKMPAYSNISSQPRQDQAAEDMQRSLMSMSGARDTAGPELQQLKSSDKASLTLQALQQLGRYLAALPGRKNLIWFASSFPVSIFPTVKEQQAPNRGPQFLAEVNETAGLLTSSRVALYPVDAQGIHVDRNMDADSGGSSQGDNFGADATHDLAARTANNAAMDQLASDTGGRAIYNTNNINVALAHDIENGAHYYTLSYTPANEKMDGTFRHIEVKLDEGKYKLAYRRGYYADAGPAPAQFASDPLVPLLTVGMPDATQIVYRVAIAPESQPATGAARAGGNAKLSGPLTRYKIVFQIPRDSMSFTTSPTGTHDAKIKVDMVAYGRDGKPMNWTGGAMSLNLNDAQYVKAQQTGIAAPMEIDLPAAELSLATGILDLNTQRAGTLQIAVNPKANLVAAPPSQ